MLSKELKKMVIMTIVDYSVALYRSETWTLRKYERDRLKALKCGHGAIWKISIGRIT